MTSLRARTVVVALSGLAVLAASAHAVSAAPSPASLTVGVQGAAPSSQPFSGGPITGSSDGSGNAAPPATCSAPACESIPLTVVAPTTLAAKQINLTITVNFSPAATNPVGLTGLDTYLLDSSGAMLGSDTTGSAPSVVAVGKLDPGSFTIEVTGEAAAAGESYTGTVLASVGSPAVPSVAYSPVPLVFAPATVVSPTLLGAEPQISFERPVAAPKAGAGLDPNRGFVDWPLSSRTQIGTLWRTQNGGDSYRQVVDLTCAERQAPNCETGGGGDTVNRVNNYDGTVNFGNQESLAQEAFASSIDHGDSFPVPRQFATTSSATAVDRQWISTVDAPGITGGPVTSFELEALFSYHIPSAGEYVAGVGTDGILRPATNPVIPGVSQSGPSRIDTRTGSKGSGWFYQSYRDSGGFEVASAPLSQYQLPTAYHVNNVSTDTPQVFPWIALDTAGNLYATWVAADGQLYYSYSLIGDPANDPTATPAGVPATKWSPKIRLNPPSLTSNVFPEVVAGSPGHIAVTFMGTPDWSGVSDGASATAKWSSYVALGGNALDAAPTFQLGSVSHKYAHIGSICTSGTTCVAPPQGDRSLDDMTDLTMDSDGRLAAVFMDNNNSFGRQEVSLGSQGLPFVKVAKLAAGPSLLSGHGPYAVTYPTAWRAAGAGDATWPNTAAGVNLPSLDILGSGVFADGPDVVGRIDLADASAAGFTRDLAAYNAVATTDSPATRLQYVVRWDTNGDSYYLAVERTAAGFSFTGGRVDASNAVSNGNSAVGLSYRSQAGFTVTGQVQGNTLLLRGDLGAFGLAPGSTLVSFSAFSMAGPADSVIAGQPATSQVFATMRTVDAAPPMDAVLSGPQDQPLVPIPGGPAQPVATVGPSLPEAPWLPLLILPAAVAAVAVRRRRQR